MFADVLDHHKSKTKVEQDNKYSINSTKAVLYHEGTKIVSRDKAETLQ